MVVGVLVCLIHPTILSADVKPVVVWNKETITNLIHQEALKNHVSAYRMQETMECEDGTFQVDKQSDYYTEKGREQSYGLAQINLPSHPDISYQEAIDPEFAVSFMAKEFSQGRASEWSCYRRIF